MEKLSYGTAIIFNIHFDDGNFYKCSKQKAAPKEQPLPHVFDEYDRIIAVDDINDPAAKAYFEKHYAKHEMQIAGKRFLKVPDDGIYTYMYNVEAAQWLIDDDDKKWLEFIFNED